jgi:hypothetical protein
MTGVVRETVNRILNDWKRCRVVSRLTGYYCLENRAILEKEPTRWMMGFVARGYRPFGSLMRLLRLSNCLRADRPKQSKYRTLQAPSNRSFFSLSIRIQSQLKPTPYFAASVLGRSRGIVSQPKVVASDAKDGRRAATSLQSS